MHRLIISACLTMAACTPSDKMPNGVYRTANAPIYSNAALDAGRLVGSWQQVATFSRPEMRSCTTGRANFSGTPDTLRFAYNLCLSGQYVAGDDLIKMTGPGRFVVSGKDQINEEFWILWVDEGYRTMAIGTPSGTFGFILNRDNELPADRNEAARQVFDFNGYDITNLITFGSRYALMPDRKPLK